MPDRYVIRVAGGGDDPPVGGGSGDPDIASLPLASGQIPRWDQFSMPAANGTFTDPLTGVTVRRITDASTFGGDSARHYYSTWSHISLPYDTNKYHILILRSTGGATHIVDYQLGVGVLAIRDISGTFTQIDQLALSRVDPHVMYSVGGGTLRKWDISGVPAEITVSPFPKTLPSSDPETMHIGGDDESFTIMRAANAGIIAFKPATDTVYTSTFAAKDHYLSTDGRWEMMITSSLIHMMDLNDGSTFNTGINGESLVNHPDGANGLFGCMNGGTRNIFRYDPATNTSTTIIGVANIANGSNHFNARWRNGSGNTQWMNASFHGGDSTPLGAFTLHSGNVYWATPTFDWQESEVTAVLKGTYGSGTWLTAVGSIGAVVEGTFFWDDAANRLYLWQPGGGSPTNILAYNPRPGWQAITFFRLDGSEHRVLCHHYSTGSPYEAEPHAQCAPDGKLVMFGSDMGVSGGRYDVFIAEVPLTA